ncbi:OB-fold domain-containing protein [Nocardioides sp. BP30]|uniref:Zn-ribbon domain-containing OB-fold protein n=1 Tax=Nocardioides sp. BP30 TaxID=3036374 RepID=UPI0024682E07|nr:OB-fold domain-containing protein [Nocardioides sp. BP30]WGL54049.1 OB-fold domain-containing protein [Nocardioides sp. BP30]
MAQAEGRMLPEVTPDSRAFWTGGFDGELRINRCQACRQWIHPPVGACWKCRSRDVAPEVASGRGTIAAYTINQHPWFPAFPPPYVVALVELEEQPGLRLTTCLVDVDIDAVEVGMAVEVVFDVQDDVALPLFRAVAA